VLDDWSETGAVQCGIRFLFSSKAFIHLAERRESRHLGIHFGDEVTAFDRMSLKMRTEVVFG
jgi:hypothetical protein